MPKDFVCPKLSLILEFILVVSVKFLQLLVVIVLIHRSLLNELLQFLKYQVLLCLLDLRHSFRVRYHNMIVERSAPFLAEKYVELRVYYRIMLYLVRNISSLYAVWVQYQLQVIHVNLPQREVVVDHFVTSRLTYSLGMACTEVRSPVKMSHPPLPGLLFHADALLRKGIIRIVHVLNLNYLAKLRQFILP